MSNKIAELRPQQKLLINQFEGYKLSLDSVPVIKNKLRCLHPNVILPNVDQYSLLHATLYGFHNHLFKDPWLPYTTYFIDNQNIVNKFIFNEDIQQFFYGGPTNQFALPQTENLDKSYNSSLQFVSENYIVLCDGSNILYILQTTNRKRLDTWNIIFSDSVLKNATGFIILDARLEEVGEEKIVHCLLLHIEKETKSFQNIIDWVSIKQDKNEIWLSSNFKQICGNGALHYCSLEPKCKALYLVSDQRYTFKSNDQNKDNAEKTSPEEDVCDGKFSIKWHQSEEDVTIIITFKEFVHKKYINITSKSDLLKIHYKREGDEAESTILLSEKIDNDLTTWNMLDSSNLEIVLYKLDLSHWKSLTKEGQIKYQEVPNSAMITRVHEQLEHLCSEVQSEGSMASTAPIQDEIDDCDFDTDYDIKNISLERLSAETDESTHHIDIGPNNPLFQICLEAGIPSALVLRHDVDALLWQLPNSSDQWPPKHIGTLPAFGYVQASKQEKKFVSCSPDFQYAVICNANRHVFLYWGKNPAGKLHNTKSKQTVPIGVQKVVTLDEIGDIIGLQTENDLVTLLTTEYIIALQLK